METPPTCCCHEFWTTHHPECPTLRPSSKPPTDAEVEDLWTKVHDLIARVEAIEKRDRENPHTVLPRPVGTTPCWNCNGTGRISVFTPLSHGGDWTSRACEKCAGRGFVASG